MKLALVAYGTRGDVQPIVCLGRALADRGHEVEMVAPADAANMVSAAELPCHVIAWDFQAMLRAKPAQRMLARGHWQAAMRWWAKEETRYENELHEAMLRASESPERLICSYSVHHHCRAIGEACGIPVTPVYLCPLHPSDEFPSIFLSRGTLGPLNRISHQLPNYVLWRSQRRGLATLRRRLGLPPATWPYWRSAGKLPALLAVSRTLFPRPQDYPQCICQTGAIEPWPELRAKLGEVGIRSDLEDWLACGPPPVYLGFGSMPVLDERSMLRTIRGALRTLGARGILASGWSEIDATGDEMLFVARGSLDHQSLFPRCAAAVHHGGAGTTTASLAAGTPTLIPSVFLDQPFWGARCRRLGIGETFPFTKLDARRLVEGLRAVMRPEVAVRASEVARRMAEEDGVASAVALIEEGGVRRQGSGTHCAGVGA